MNYQFFDLLYRKFQCDEVKVIGKEIEYDGRWYHIIGLTLKEKKATLYVFEFDENAVTDECDFSGERDMEKTPRESMKQSMRQQENKSLFLHAREFRCDGRTYETAGSTSGSLKNNDQCEVQILCMLMRQAGWQIEKESVFYKAGWDALTFTEVELGDEFERLPDWKSNLTAVFDVMPRGCVVEMPVVLEPGKEKTINFAMEDGSDAECYINKVYLMDVWADAKEHFEHSEYRERMLQHMTVEEFETGKNHFMQALEETCPPGKYYMAVEYECSRDVSVSFYDKGYLDTVPKPKMGSATALLISVKPDKKMGSHGLKLRGCVIQTPLDAETESLDAELFSYSESVSKSEVMLY